MKSLVTTPSPFSEPDPISSVELSSSSLSDIPIASGFGTFLSQGLAETQIVRDSVFSNLTKHDTTEEGDVTFVRNCVMEGSIMMDSEDTFYGLIVSGLSCKTTASFHATNSTFMNCMRQDPISPELLRSRLEQNGECPSSQYPGLTTTNQSYSCSLVLDPGFGHADSYTFVTCTFTTCSTDGSGGAIYLTQSSILHSNPDGLTLRKCTFTGCIATYHGGAVFAEYVRDVEIDDTQFITCGVRTTEFTTRNVHDSDGGAVLLNYTSRNLCVKNSTFSGNTAASRGGGLYLGNIQASQSGHLVDTCKFISNTAKYTYSDMTGIIAGVGGGASMLPLQQVTIAGSLFQSNTAGWHGGGLTFSYHYVPAKGTLQWLVFKDNTQGYSGYDIYIRAPTMSESITDEFTFTNIGFINRYEFNTSANEKSMDFNDAFLSAGPAVYKYPTSPTGPPRTNSSCRIESTSTCYTLVDALKAARKEDNIFKKDRVDHVKQSYTPDTIRVYLISSTSTTTTHDIGYKDSAEVGSTIVYFRPKGITDKTKTKFTINPGTRDTAVFTVGNTGYAFLSYFTIAINTAMNKPLVEVEDKGNANGHVRLDTMAISSANTHSQSSSLFVIKKGEIYMKQTTISTIKTSNAPLIDITPATTTAARFVSTEFSSITRVTDVADGGDGAVFSVSFNGVDPNTGITITGLNCKDCSAAGNGGAVSVVLTNSHDLTLSGCTFTGCSCTEKGGAVYVSVTDTGSYIRVLSSGFSKSGAPSKGDYIYIDCKDGEVIGTASNWVGTINATGASSQSQAFWLDSGSDTAQRKHYAKALYYFVYTPADGEASAMIVDYSGGADIRTCGWDITNGIPCKSLTAAITQRDDIQTVKLKGYAASESNPTVGSTPFTINATLAITTLGTPETEQTQGTVPILRITDDWKTKSAIFSVTSDTTSFTNVNVKIVSKLPTQAIFGKVPYQANKDYDGEIKMENVQITVEDSLSAGAASYYFFYIQGNGTLTLKSVTVTDVTIGSYPLIGVSTQTRSTVNIESCSFTRVKNTNGRGSVLSLSTSSYVRINLAGTISFTECISGNDKFGAIYDSEALTDPNGLVDQRTFINFGTSSELSFDNPNGQKHIYINETEQYMFGLAGSFKSGETDPRTIWRRLLGITGNQYPTGDAKTAAETYADYYWGVCSDSKAEGGFALLHAAFTPSEANQNIVYVAGNVDGKQQYYDVDRCGWKDVPCKTIALALAQKSDVVSLTINLKAGTHESESADESTFRNIPGSVPITIQSYGGSVIKSVESMSAALFTVLETAVVTFSGFTFTGTTDSQPLIDVKSGGSLTLTNMKFDVSATSTALVTLTGITVDDVTDNKKKPRFAVTGTSFPHSTTEGANIKIMSTDGTIFATNLNEDYKSSLKQQFPIATCLEEGYNTYWVDETNLAEPAHTKQTASLLHFIHAPADTDSPATTMHVQGTSGADIDTCGWSDLPCSTYKQAREKRGTLPIQFDADYTINSNADASTTISTGSLVIQGSTKDITLNLADHTFTVSGGALTIKTITLTNRPGQGTASLISVTGASTIAISDSTFEDISECTEESAATCTTGKAAVLSVDAEVVVSLTLSNSRFNRCQSTASTKGGVIYFVAKPDSTITVDTCNFTECKCNAESGKGGFLYIDCKGFSTSNKLGFKIINPYCGDATHKTVGDQETIISTNVASVGSGLYICCPYINSGPTLSNILAAEMFVVNVDDSTSPTTYYSFWGQDYSHASDEVDLLLHYNIYTSTEIYVSAAAVSVEDSKCGSSEKWCPTLIKGADHVLPGKNSKIYLDKNTPFSTPHGAITLRDVTVTPWTAKSGDPPIPITINADDSLTVEGSVKMEKIAFTVTTTAAALFSTPASTTLTLTDCTISGTGIGKTLFSVAGSLVLKDLKATGVVFSPTTTPLITTNGGSVSIQGTSTTQSLFTVTGCIVSSSNSATVEISKTSIDGINGISTTLFSFGGPASLTDCVIGGSTSESCTEPVITVTAATSLTLAKTTVKNLQLDSKPLVSLVTSASLILNGSTLQNLKMNHADACLIACPTDNPVTLISDSSNDNTECEFDTITKHTLPSLFTTSESSTVSLSNTRFTFPNAGTGMTDLMKINGAASFTKCEFTHASALEIVGTLITIAGSGAVTFDDCEMKNVKSLPTNPVISSTSSGKITMSSFKMTFAETPGDFYTLISNSGEVEFVSCWIPYVADSGKARQRTNSGTPTLKAALISSPTVTLRGTSIGSLTIGSGGSIVSASCTGLTLKAENDQRNKFSNIEASEERTLFLGTFTTARISETDFTGFSSLHLFTLPASSNVTDCTFSTTTALTNTIIASGDVSFYRCEISGQNMYTFIQTSGTVTLVDTTVGDTKELTTMTLKDSFIDANTVSAQNTTFKSIVQSSNSHSLFTKSFTLTNCTFKGITPNDPGNKAFIQPNEGGVTISAASFIYPSTDKTWNMIHVFGGTELNKCTFKREEDTGDASALDIKGTLITIAPGNANDVTISESSFINIHSTTQGKPVINCEASITLSIVDTTFTYISQATLYELVAFTTHLDVTSSTFGLSAEAEAKATLNTPLFSVPAGGSLKIASTTIESLETKTLIEAADNAQSVTIDNATFKQVTQPESANQDPKPSLFNIQSTKSIIINNCTFDSTYQVSDQVLLSTSGSNTLSVTQTRFRLPSQLSHSIIAVSSSTTFKECTFECASAAQTTTLSKPLLTTTNDRTEITLESCTFTYLEGSSCHPVVELKETGHTVALTAKGCSFENVTSTLESGKVFDATTKASFDDCKFTEDHTKGLDDSGVLNICGWNTSIVKLSAGTFTFMNTEFSNISSGALEIADKAAVTITGWEKYFKNNHPAIKGYQSMNRNIMCTNSDLSIIDNTINAKSSLYVVSSGCTLHDDAATPKSPFFVPVLSACAPAMDGNTNLILNLEGTDLIPCSLYFQIYIVGGKEPAFTGPVSESSDVNPSMRMNADGDLSKAVTVNVSLANTPEIYGQTADKIRLEYGDSQHTDPITMNPLITFPSEREAKGGMAEEDEETSNWLLYVIIGVSAFLFLVIVILVIYCCCCREKDERKYEEEDWDDAEDDKTRTNAALMSLATNSLIPKFEFNEFDEKKVLSVECMTTVAPYGRAVASSKNSLYSRIHSPSHRQEHNPFIWTATIAYHIAKGLLHIIDVVYNQGGKGNEEVSVDVMKKMLNTISPHSVFFGERDSILIGSVPNNYPVPVSANAKEGKAEFNLECQRYRSPEMAAHPNDESRQMKESNAVFALGFMMYEIFTGWLVFDGYPYARVVEMVASGARPDLVLVRSVDSNFASIIDAATAMDADQRLTLSQLLERIDMYLPSELRTGDAPTFVPRSMMDDDDDEDL